MLRCKECIKNDVCRKMIEINQLWGSLQLNPDFQKVKDYGQIDINCSNFRERERHVYRG